MSDISSRASRHRQRVPRACIAIAVTVFSGVAARAQVSPAPTAAATPETPASTYRFVPAIDVPVLVLGSLGWAAPYAFSSRIITPTCPCDRASVNAFDRGAIGHHSDLAGYVSDGTVGLALLAPAIIMVRGAAAPAAWEDLSVYAEVLVVNGALATVVKFAVQRPLPRTYEGQADLVSSPRGYRSFYSGHTSLAFAALSAGSMTMSLRYGHVWVPWLVTLAVGASVGAERVLGGYHFPSDVLVGALVGTATGVIIPYLHARRDRSSSVRFGIFPSGRSVWLAATGSF